MNNINNWILDEVVENLENRLKTLEKMMQDEGFQPIYKAAMNQEILFLKEELDAINEMKLEEVEFDAAADEDYRQNRSYAQI